MLTVRKVTSETSQQKCKDDSPLQKFFFQMYQYPEIFFFFYTHQKTSISEACPLEHSRPQNDESGDWINIHAKRLKYYIDELGNQ